MLAVASEFSAQIYWFQEGYDFSYCTVRRNIKIFSHAQNISEIFCFESHIYLARRISKINCVPAPAGPWEGHTQILQRVRSRYFLN
jgi:hypothetical protein